MVGLLFISHEKNLHDIVPVSYTHLDVYKRQDEDGAANASRHQDGDEDQTSGREENLRVGSFAEADERGGVCLLYTSRCV